MAGYIVSNDYIHAFRYVMALILVCITVLNMGVLAAENPAETETTTVELPKTAEVYILSGNPAIGILGVPIGTALCNLAISVLNILAIRREGRINVSPGADFTFAQKDILVVLGDSTALKKVQKL